MLSIHSTRVPARIVWGGRGGLLLLLTLLTVASLPAQPTAQHAASVPALFLSDIHLDPYSDPAKVPLLNAAPAENWAAIFATPDSTTQAADSAALQHSCPVRGVDTNDHVWQSSLHAIHTRAAHVEFVTISGDLLAHQFDCKYKTLLPAATQADYLAFTEKTVRYITTTLQQALPSTPLYIGMGNNDSGCTDYALDATHDAFLARIAPIVAQALPQPDRDAVVRDFAVGGYYSVPLARVPHTRLIVLDDLFLSTKYATCSGKPDPAPGAAQLAWFEGQLTAARGHNEKVWVLGHIPPGVNLYASARTVMNLCSGAKPQMFLGSEKLEEILASNADIIRLALFGHTHSDEMRLLQPETGSGPFAENPGVPVRIVASITPVNGNRPTFTIARINPTTAKLADYTVFIASNLTGVATTWSQEYTYSTTYHQPAFDGPALRKLIAGFQADPAAATPASDAYLRDYFPGDVSSIIKFAWPQYACSLNHDSAAAFTACTCPK